MRRALSVVAIAATVLSGCMTTTHRMDIDDLNNFQIDCSNKDAQIRFLESQLTREREWGIASMEMHSLLGQINAANDGTLKQKRAIVDRRYDAIVRVKIWDLRTYCP